MKPQFSDLLKRWRGTRHLSQLQLALEADVSARHISFLESGRAQPSKEMVHQLARTLQMPHQQINQALLSAGFAPAFRSQTSAAPDIAPINRAVKTILENHMPLPAIVLDRHWNITRMNGAGRFLLGAIGLEDKSNLVEITMSAPLMQIIENWAEASTLLLHRLEVDYRDSGGDPVLGALADSLRDCISQKHPKAAAVDYSQAVIPTRIKLGSQRLSLFSTLAQFSTVFDTQLDDLRIEMMFPMDHETEAFFQNLAP